MVGQEFIIDVGVTGNEFADRFYVFRSVVETGDDGSSHVNRQRRKGFDQPLQIARNEFRRHTGEFLVFCAVQALYVEEDEVKLFGHGLEYFPGRMSAGLYCGVESSASGLAQERQGEIGLREVRRRTG